MSFSPEEMERRRQGIGASDIAAICGVSPYRSPRDVYFSKVEGRESPETRNMRHGIIFERSIMETYEFDSGLKIKKGKKFFSKEWPRAFATPDGLIGRDTVVEAKFVPVAWRDWQDGVPLHYQAQVQWQMGVSGRCKAVVLALLSGVKSFEIDQNIDAYNIMLDRAQTFWRDHVEPRIPPPFDFAKDEEAIRGIAQTTQELKPRDDMVGLVEKIIELKKQNKEIESTLRAAENQLREAIGEDEGIIAQGYRATLKTTKNKTRMLKIHEP